MKMDVHGNITLTSGRTWQAHCGILGMSPFDFCLTNGYDSQDEWEDAEGGFIATDHREGHEGGTPFTPEERREIAVTVIGWWTQWAAKP